MMEYKRMKFPAPRRCSVEQASGLYHTEKWTVETVQEYKTVGGWFAPGSHDFADKAAVGEAFGLVKGEA